MSAIKKLAFRKFSTVQNQKLKQIELHFLREAPCLQPSGEGGKRRGLFWLWTQLLLAGSTRSNKKGDGPKAMCCQKWRQFDADIRT